MKAVVLITPDEDKINIRLTADSNFVDHYIYPSELHRERFHKLVDARLRNLVELYWEKTAITKGEYSFFNRVCTTVKNETFLYMMKYKSIGSYSIKYLTETLEYKFESEVELPK